MSTNDPVEDAVQLLLTANARAKEEVARIEEALRQLGRPVPITVVFPGHTITVPPKPPSIRQLVVSLLDEEEVSWSAPEVLEALEIRGADLGNANDPINAIRARS